MNWLSVAWIAYTCIFVVHYLRLRGPRAVVAEKSQRDKAGLVGVLLQLSAVILLWTFRIPERSDLRILSIVLAAASFLFTLAAVRSLGRHWRINAVVTSDHQLITSGPYSLVRHPIYLGLLVMIVANVVDRTSWIGGIALAALYLAGTEIRVRAEDKLLTSIPGAAEYQIRVPAYLPGLR